MSTQQVKAQQVGLARFPGLGHFLVILIISGIEISGLVKWLQLESGASLSAVLGPLASIPQVAQLHATVGMTGFAGIILGAYLLVEHIITQVDATRGLTGRQFLELFTFTSLEVVIWIVWLALIPVNGILALVFFLTTLFVEHQLADNVKKGLPFLHFASLSSKVFLGIIVFTIFEVVGAGIWVSVGSTIGLVALAIGSIVEHYLAFNVGQIRE